jgi:hypothetical protein
MRKMLIEYITLIKGQSHEILMASDDNIVQKFLPYRVMFIFYLKRVFLRRYVHLLTPHLRHATGRCASSWPF